MKKFRYIIAAVFVVAMGTGIFWACQKDTYKSDAIQNEKLEDTKNHKSMGNHEQPTNIININTVINDSIVVGSAEVGDYDGRIYVCNITWTIHIDQIDEDFELRLFATLKPEYEDLMMEVDPIIGNYIITINENNVSPDFILTEGGIEIITYATISELWTNIITECNQNTTINEVGAEALALSRETGINIFELAEKSYFSEYMTYIYDMYNMYSDSNGLLINDSIFYAMLNSGSESLFLTLHNGIQSDFPTFNSLSENMQDAVVEVTEKVCMGPDPGLKGKGWFNFKVKVAGWLFDHGLINQSEYDDKICNAYNKLVDRNGIVNVRRFMNKPNNC